MRYADASEQLLRLCFKKFNALLVTLDICNDHDKVRRQGMDADRQYLEHSASLIHVRTITL